MTGKLSQAAALERASQHWPNFAPSVPFMGVHRAWAGVCLACGNPVAPRLAGAGRQGCCPYCAENRLDDAIVLGKMLAVDLVPLDPYPGPLKPWRCRCLRCGAVVTPKYNSVDQKGSGCEACGRVLAHKNGVITRTRPSQGESLLDLFPEIAAQADGWDASTVKPNSTRRLKWRCERGHTTFATVASRSGGSTCRTCNAQTVGRITMVPRSGQSLLDVFPHLAAQAEGWDPSQVTPKSKRLLKWRCPVGHVWDAEVHARANGRGCPDCASYGFNALGKAYVYVVASDTWIKLGISNEQALESRLAKHRRQGLDQLLHLVLCDVGRDAKAAEDLWLDFVRNQPLLARPRKSDLRDGYTEAIVDSPAVRRWITEELGSLLDLD